MEMTNKEAVEKLTKYFLTQNPETVARTLSGMMIDFNRILNFNHLPKKEKESLRARIEENVNNILDFLKNGSEIPLRCVESCD